MLDLNIPDLCEKLFHVDGILDIPEELYQSLSKEQAIEIAEYFNNDKLIKLPQKEIEFFEWLKINDEKVWHDLWLDEINEPYYVSITFLPALVYSEFKGFLICDLLNNENYYFTPKLMVDEESKIMVESSKERYLNKESLTVAQLLALTISFTETDIWHFAYKYNFEIERVKKAVAQLVEDNVLIHLTEAAHLTPFVYV